MAIGQVMFLSLWWQMFLSLSGDANWQVMFLSLWWQMFLSFKRWWQLDKLWFRHLAVMANAFVLKRWWQMLLSLSGDGNWTRPDLAVEHGFGDRCVAVLVIVSSLPVVCIWHHVLVYHENLQITYHIGAVHVSTLVVHLLNCGNVTILRRISQNSCHFFGGVILCLLYRLVTPLQHAMV